MKTLLLLILPVFAHAQNNYKGTVVNKITKERIPFATIGLKKENRGTNADENGHFDLEGSNSPGDSLIISCVGFETAKFGTSTLPADGIFGLTEKEASLKPVIVKSSRTSLTMNDFSGCGINAYTSSGSVTQVAQYFQVPTDNSLLSEINICKRGDRCRFRIRIYDVDPVSKKPSNDLADTLIEVTSGSRHVSIDMEKYRIFIPGKDFFVAIEWLYIPENENHVKWKVNGEKKIDVQYSPYLFFRTSDKQNMQTEVQTWQKYYNGTWGPMHLTRTLLISATVKY